MNETHQLSLFGDEQMARPRINLGRGVKRDCIYKDYESFLKKFSETPKTTDDCYTPSDVFDVIVEYVGTIIDMSNKVICRPFFPGGDYVNSYYPENAVVIDNPPFSIFTEIVKFYTSRNIPFFLFGNGMTIIQHCKYATVVVISEGIIFENGANVRCNFLTNLLGDIAVISAPELDKAIKNCPSQRKTEKPRYIYPDEVFTVSDAQTICRGGGQLQNISKGCCRLYQ